MRHYGKLLSVGVAVLGGLFVATTAKADIIPALVGSPVLITSGPLMGDYTVTYDAQLAGTGLSAERIDDGDYFTIFDVSGLVLGSEGEPTLWTPTEELTGGSPFPPGTVTDNALIENVTWTYTGSTLDGPTDLGDFTLVTTLNELNNLGAYASLAINSSGTAADGSADKNQGSVPVPSTSVPLPAGGLVGLAALSALALAFGARRAMA